MVVSSSLMPDSREDPSMAVVVPVLVVHAHPLKSQPPLPVRSHCAMDRALYLALEPPMSVVTLLALHGARVPVPSGSPSGCRQRQNSHAVVFALSTTARCPSELLPAASTAGTGIIGPVQLLPTAVQ